MKKEPLKGVRLDRWLWAARFYKTRSLAQDAIRGGKVHVNGKRVKPSRLMKQDDRVEITREGVQYDVRVAGLSDKRGPASTAATLYVESEASIARREAFLARRALERRQAAERPGRPDKRARRHIIRFTRKREIER